MTDNRNRYKRGKSARSNIPPLRPGAERSLKKVFENIGVPAQKPFTPDPFQTEAVAIVGPSDCLVTAPTGAGKTWIATQAIAKFQQAGWRSWYASPLKALSNSKYIEFGRLYGEENVGILTGDRKENPDAEVLVGTTEILRNQLYDAMYQGESLKSDFVILDEAHFLGDPDRGVVWEEIMIYLPARIPLLMLSATVGNADQIADWLSAIRGRPCEVVKETQRPVPLYPLFFHPTGTLYPLLARGKSAKPHKKVADYAKQRKPPVLAPPGKLPPFGDILKVLRKYNLLPALFFLKSRADCDGALEQCRKNLIGDPERVERIQAVVDGFVDMTPRLAKHRQLEQLERMGVGSHHSGQLPAWKMLVESLMTRGLLDAVFATSTVAAGVNFPARTVVFLNSDKFNGVDFLPLTPTEFHQMTGRAGRRGMDKIGFALALPGKFMDLRHIVRLIDTTASDVLSQIRINFSMTLNLLLSHEPKQIQELLSRSFATYLMATKKGKKQEEEQYLWEDFLRHFEFLKESGFAQENGELTEDGIWASQLRVDEPLMIAEGFRRNLFPAADPALMAAIIASFVNEREPDDRMPKGMVPKPLGQAFRGVKGGLKSFVMQLAEHGFLTRPLFIRPALAIWLWAADRADWEDVLEVAQSAEGDLAMLILRTADNLRHIRGLHQVFPQAARTADQAIASILKDPVTGFF